MTLEMSQSIQENNEIPHDGINRKILYREEQITQRIKELGKQISEDYKDKAPVMVGVLNGATFFLTKLMNHLDPDILAEMDSIKLSSYGAKMESSGDPQAKDISIRDITNRHVIIVEDVVDTGQSIQRAVEILSEKNPASIKVCALVSKPEARKVEVNVDYLGFDNCPNRWIEGFGMDSYEKNRGLTNIYIRD